MFCHVDDTVKSLTLRISSCLRLACSLIELTRQTNANDFLSDSVEIKTRDASCSAGANTCRIFAGGGII